jgi:tetratricopeptide (TPR) repeat protein
MVGASSTEFVAAAGTLADAGSPAGGHELYELLTNPALASQLEARDLKAVVGSLVNYYSARDQEEEGIERLSGAITGLVDDPDRSDSDKAFFINQLQKLCYGANRDEEAQRHGEQAVRLLPTEPSYHFNLSLVYERRGLLDLAERSVDEYMKAERSESSADHLAQAVEIYLKRGRVDDAKRCFEKLASMDDSSQRSLRVLMDEDIQQVLSSVS